jgi:hypothetical protein
VTGVPRGASFGTDFMIVRADLVRALGNPIDVLVWTRINWRCEMQGQHTIADEDGLTWWPASREMLSEETGLSTDQVKRSLIRLKENGFIDATELRTGGNYDRTKSYRPLFEGDIPSADIDSSTGQDRPIERADMPNVPITETLKDNTPQREPRKRATRMTADWVPSEAQRAKTFEEYGETHDLKRELDAFRDHFLAASGQNASKLDWDATWRNWMRRARPNPTVSSPKGQASGGLRMTAVQRNLARMQAGGLLGGEQKAVGA